MAASSRTPFSRMGAASGQRPRRARAAPRVSSASSRLKWPMPIVSRASFAESRACRLRPTRKAAKTLTGHPKYMAMMLDYHAKNGDGTQQEIDAVKERWLEGKKQGIKDLEQIIKDCERQAKAAENSADATRLLATVFDAKLAWDVATPGSNQRAIYADAVAAMSAIDRHEETNALIPFLQGSAYAEWREDPKLGLHLMERAIHIAEKLYGNHSVERAEQLANLAYLFSFSTIGENPHADAERAEELFDEALAIYERHPDAMATENYSGLVGQARNFYQEIGNTERASELADLNAALAERDNTP